MLTLVSVHTLGALLGTWVEGYSDRYRLPIPTEVSHYRTGGIVWRNPFPSPLILTEMTLCDTSIGIFVLAYLMQFLIFVVSLTNAGFSRELGLIIGNG